MRALSVFVFVCLLAGCQCGPARVGVRPLDGGGGMDAATGDSGGAGEAGPRDAAALDGQPLRDGGEDPDSGRPPVERTCDDGFDGDMDGQTDCEDSDCDGQACDAAGSTCRAGGCDGCRGETTETACGDGDDEDCDGLRDCLDPDCDGVVCGLGGATCGGGLCPCASGFDERLCGDNTDDDCDGLVDCADPDCLNARCSDLNFVCGADGSCACMGGGVELCQDFDDDCDGVVDDGCPRSINSCCPATTPSAGGGSGTPWFDACPMGAALVGIAGRASAGIDQLQPICATIRFLEDGTATPEHIFTVERGADILGAAHGAAGAAEFSDRCGANEFVVGIDGHADLALDRISLRCAAFSISRSGLTWQFILHDRPSTPTRGAGGTGEMAFGSDCGPTGVVTGIEGRADTSVTSLAFTCRTLSLDLR